MADIVGRYTQVEAAFDDPTLTLIHRPKTASLTPRLTVTLLTHCFTPETPTIPVALLHRQVSNLLDDLRLRFPAIPDKDGRALCAEWMTLGWLNRPAVDSGEDEIYTLSSHSRRAIDLIESLDTQRAMFSEHRLAMTMNAVRDLNVTTNPDRSQRLASIDKQIQALEEQRALFADETIPLVIPSDDTLLNGFANILDLIGGLRGEFVLVAEAFESERRNVLEEFRASDGPVGETVSRHLARTDALETATPAGQAFIGAVDLLRNTGLLYEFENDLQALAESESGRSILDAADKRQLLRVTATINDGIEMILRQRASTTKALRSYLSTHNVTQDRELGLTLKRLDEGFTPWLERTGVRAAVPVDLLPGKLVLEHTTKRFYDPKRDAPPPPLHQDEGVPPAAPSVEQLLAWGGPTLAALRTALEQAASTPQSPGSLADVFNELPAHLRRPVEVLGLLHVAARDGYTSGPGDDSPVDLTTVPLVDLEAYETVRHDGTTRTFYSPRLPLNTGDRDD